MSATDNLLLELLNFQRELEKVRRKEKADFASEKEIKRNQSKIAADSQVYSAISVVVSYSYSFYLQTTDMGAIFLI